MHSFVQFFQILLKALLYVFLCIPKYEAINVLGSFLNNSGVCSIKILILSIPLFSGCAKKESILRVGTSADFPPFEYVDENTKEFTGFDLDLIRLLGQKMGYDKVEIVNMNFDTLIPSLSTGKVDVVIAGTFITDERLKTVDAIQYLTSREAIIVKKDSTFEPKSLSDLSGHKIGVQKGTIDEVNIDNAIANGKVTNVNVMRYTSAVLAITDLQNGAIDAMLIELPVAAFYSKKQGFKITARLNTYPVGIFVRKGNTALLDSLTKALDAVKSSNDWDSLIKKYFGTLYGD